MKKTVYIDITAAEQDTDAIIKYIDSDRSDGKTTHMIRRAYDGMKQHGKTAVLARRHVGDITKTYIEQLCGNLRVVRPDCGELTAAGSPKKDGVFLFADGVRFAQVVPLSRADAIKGALDEKSHRDLYVDEYVPLNGRYLKDEVTALLEMWFTIDRRTYSNSIYVFSNRPTTSNPLFSYFQVVPRVGLSRWKNGRFLLLRVVNKGNREQIEQSPFGELIDGTPYAGYAYGGKGIKPVDRLICPAHGRGRMPVVVIDAAPVGFYAAGGDRIVVDYVRDRRPEDSIYTTTRNAGHGGGIYLPLNKSLTYSLRIMFLSSKLMFANEQVLFDCQELFKILGGKE